MSARKIVVTSGKGGVGKTTTTANLGAALAKQNHRVILIDADIGLRNLDLVLGLEKRIVFDVVEVAEGRCQLRQALIKDKRFNSLSILPAAQTRDKDAINEQQFAQIADEAAQMCDYVLIDCPAGIEAGFRNAVAGADEGLIVTTPEVSAIRDADRVIGKLHEKRLPVRLIINRVRPEMVRSGDMLSVEDVCEILSAELLGIVPDDEEVIDSTNRGEPVALSEQNRLRTIYDKIARRLEGELVPFTNLDKQHFSAASLPERQASMHQELSTPEQKASAEPAELGRAIVITSGKGGVGKTTTTANLGHALAARGASVALIDADVGLRNLDIVLGLESRVKYHVLDVLEEKVSLEDALVQDKYNDNLVLLAAAQAREKDEVDTEKMRALVQKLREEFDYVLIDCPAGIEMGFKNAIIGADEAIVVCTPEVSAVRDVDRVIGLLGNRFKPQLIINRLRPHLVRKGKMLSVEDVNGILRLPLLGVIADTPEIIVTTNKGEPLALHRNGPTANAYHAIAARIDGEDVPAPTVATKQSFLERLGALFGGPKMIEFLRKLFGQPGSSTMAKERLRLVLMSDHLSLAPEMVDQMKADLVEVISRYVKVDLSKIEVSFEQQDTALAMLANIPILSVNRQNEIDEQHEHDEKGDEEPNDSQTSATPGSASMRRRRRRPKKARMNAPAEAISS